MANVKVPALLHKMSVPHQKAWYKKNNMPLPDHLTGVAGKSAAQAKKDVGEINKAKASQPEAKPSSQEVIQNLRKINIERTKRAMELGTAHRSGGVGTAGSSANASPLEKKLGSNTIQNLDKKKMASIGASPAERDLKKITDKEAPQGIQRKPTKLTGRKLSIVGEEAEQVDEIKITNVTPPRGLPGKSSAQMGKEFRDSMKKWNAENPPGKYDKDAHMKKVLANIASLKKEEVEDVVEGYKKPTSQVEKARRLGQTHKTTGFTGKNPFKDYPSDVQQAYKNARQGVEEEVEQVNEMDKSQPSSSRGAEGLATGSKATPITAKKTTSAALVTLDQAYAKGRLGRAPRGSKTLKGMSDVELVKKLTKEEAEQVDEAATEPSDKELRMARGIAFGKRYKEGNMTGAVNAIEKIRIGLSKHPKVASALRAANEETSMSHAKQLAKKIMQNQSKHPIAQLRGEEVEQIEESSAAMEVSSKKKVDEEVEPVTEKYMGFKKVMAAVAAKGARNPAAVAAAIGRKKYGKEKFQAMAAAGKKTANEEVEINEAPGKTPETETEVNLAKKSGDPKKITYGDVIKARIQSAKQKALKGE